MSDLIEQLKGPFNYAPRKKGEPHYLKVPEQLIEAVFSRIEELEEENRAFQDSYNAAMRRIDLLERAQEKNHERD